LKFKNHSFICVHPCVIRGFKKIASGQYPAPDQDQELILEEKKSEDFSKYTLGLTKLRRRRCFFWSMILIYIPTIWLSLRITHSDRQTGKVFAVWFLLIIIASLLAAAGKCPRCGNYFHVNGFIPIYLRKCLHCGLHITADKKQRKKLRKEKHF